MGPFLLFLPKCLKYLAFQRAHGITFIRYTHNRTKMKRNTTGATCGAGTAYQSGTHEIIPGISGVRVAQTLGFCVMFC